MIRRILTAGLFVITLMALSVWDSTNVEAAPPGQSSNWQRFHNYPYVYYPHTFQPQNESSGRLYNHCTQQWQMPVYNKSRNDFYPEKKPWQSGTHYSTDLF